MRLRPSPLFPILGALVGAGAGVAYFFLVGCRSG
jgi:hypothetical protein